MDFIVLFGGNSYEHEISIVSAITLKKELDNISHFIFVDSAKDIYLIPKDKMTSKHFSSFGYKKDSRLSIVNGGFEKQCFLKKDILRGVVINLIHGKSGEDGQIASLMEFYNINYIGPRIEGSVVSFNKELTKIFAKNRGVNVLDYYILRRNDDFSFLEQKIPFILKPLRLGSSIGISIVKDKKDIEYALDNSFEFDNALLAESFISNVREYNLAGCLVGDEFRLSMIEEVKKDEYFNFDNKYLDFRGDREKKEAQLDKELKNKIIDSFKKLYLNCFEGAIVRCDFFVIDNDVYINEINPVPGSMSYYLFSNFKDVINSLSNNLPKSKNIAIKYQYISKIQSQKGK
ncbi:D-alanine--D-alanine ligase [Helicobacter sp. MIT 14-3879]|uniref:D-alanine--D-alanine ligase n=1 Tax=Helicobacter sp. MIT 14-3879 TaxID=2040649 RepID=UPI000E1ED0B4|nr:D-alanine--D-alanine ligase [Helicobacter sp. MIT 14-3879]RDU65473.1 D-alanine--D-alanine ligase [Helicobacter sp. MIT 14-3879]